MAVELDEFHRALFQDVMACAHADGSYAEQAFFENFCNRLVDDGELETADYCYFGGHGMRIDGYGGDPASFAGELALVISEFSQSPEIASLTQSSLDAIFKRPLAFVAKSLDTKFRNALEETDPGFGLADMIAARWGAISRIRVILISNKLLSARVEGKSEEAFDGRPVIFDVWDIGRVHRKEASSAGREDIEIDLEQDFGGGIPALPAHLHEAAYEAYLAVVPGKQLAAIYERWRTRLLEQNVRVFLQIKGNVNKGIRNTLDNDPEMFFAYNNGITATAEAIETRETPSGLVIVRMKNFQIVNGGQSTASIHAASRKKDADLSRVFVQMKLSIVPPERTMEVVPKISEYANSQNKVSAADFFSNHPFHVRLEDASRRLFAPSPDGTFRESKWFYERARGQYQDERAKLSDAARRKFDLEYPRSQLFVKTDLAKFLNLWRGYPEIVSRGAQKNFAQFALLMGKDWTKDSDQFNDDFFREAVAKAIIFRATERLVTDQDWYAGGYRANIVAYAIAKVAHDLEKLDLNVNFQRIWRTQAISKEFTSALELAAKAANDVLVDPPAMTRNVTEWAKNQACWNRVRALKIDWPESWLEELSTREERKEEKRAAVKDQKMLNGIEAQSFVVNAGAAFWERAREWGEARKLLSPMEAGVLETAASMPKRIPSDKQSLIAVESLRKLHGEGYPEGTDLL
jgi:hypothetical protein